MAESGFTRSAEQLRAATGMLNSGAGSVGEFSSLIGLGQDRVEVATQLSEEAQAQLKAALEYIKTLPEYASESAQKNIAASLELLTNIDPVKGLKMDSIVSIFEDGLAEIGEVLRIVVAGEMRPEDIADYYKYRVTEHTTAVQDEVARRIATARAVVQKALKQG